MAALIDTNILVYRFDNRFPEKQRISRDILRRGVLEDSVRVPHQATVEFVAAVTRPRRGLLEILTEHLQHDRLYGTVRVLNPFIGPRPPSR